MSDENKIQTNRVERSTNGAFCAFWHGQMTYENGRVKRFDTEREAWAYLARCDAVGKIISLNGGASVGGFLILSAIGA